MANTTEEFRQADWSQVKGRYGEICEAVGALEVGTAEEYSRLRFSFLTYGQIHSVLREKIEAGHAVYDKIEERQEIWLALAHGLGSASPDQQFVPEFMLVDVREPVDHWKIVSCGLETKRISDQFMMSWAELNRLYGVYQALITTSEGSEQNFRAVMAGMLAQSTEIQKYWYSHWINAHAPSLKQSDRGDAENELQDLCANIAERETPNWEPYPREWFLRMVAEPKHCHKIKGEYEKAPGVDYSLSWRFRNIPLEKLKEMLSDPIITADILPPADPLKFKDKKAPPGGAETK